MKQQAFNPYLPSYEYVPDGEPRVFGDRVYIYGSHDAFGGSGYCPNDYVCWSAPLDDLGSWRYEGVIYPKDRDPMNPEGRSKLFAPDVVQGPDGRYYLYYVFHDSAIVGVAVCDTPAGEYQFYGYVHLPDGRLYGSLAGDVKNFDPGVLVDDGRVYLYTGFAPGRGWLLDMLSKSGQRIDGGYCMELETDMLTVKREPVLVAPGVFVAEGTGFEAHPFFEASSIRKIGQRYYFVYSSLLSHELCYAVSDRPDGGFRFGGTLVSIVGLGYQGNTQPDNNGGNTHGGLIELNGQWYIFYHRHTNRCDCSRQGCAEPVTIAADGSIAQVETTSCGLNGGPLRGCGTYEARIACNLGGTPMPYFTQTGTDREDSPDQYIAGMTDGAWCGFKYFSFENTWSIRICVRASAGGTIRVSTDRGAGAAAVIPVTASEDWKEYSAPFTPDGVKPLYFTCCGAGEMDFREFTLESI